VCNGGGGCNLGDSPPLQCWQDVDGDGYGGPTPHASCVSAGCPGGHVTNNSDCYDANANARPGQTGCFTTHRGDGSFDYDCSGGPTKCSGVSTYVSWCGGPPACFGGGMPCQSGTGTVTTAHCGQSLALGCSHTCTTACAVSGTSHPIGCQ